MTYLAREENLICHITSSWKINYEKAKQLYGSGVLPVEVNYKTHVGAGSSRKEKGWYYSGLFYSAETGQQWGRDHFN